MVNIDIPVEEEELKSREIDYPMIGDIDFAKKYRGMLFRTVNITVNGTKHKIQMNFCTNHYCKWFNQQQMRFDKVRNKPFRYKLVGGKNYDKRIFCNPDPTGNTDGTTFNCQSTTLSNWSIAEEIKRLSINDTVSDLLDTNDYKFHKEDCPNIELTPFIASNEFYKRGKSSSKSQKWQCKSCKKITNVLPSRNICTNYHQKRNDILPLFAKLLISRTPVKRTCDILSVTPTTYYNKLEWLYKKCLEFNERHETQAFKKLELNRVWVNTDAMIYYLNNVRMHGKGGKDYDDVEEQRFPTYLIVSSDMDSRYVFRTDIAFDWNASLDILKSDTELYKEDHLYDFSQKNARLRFSYYPQPPVACDNETVNEYKESLDKIIRRADYVSGLHVKATYTMLAHLWSIKQLVNAKKWRFVTDHDNSIITAIYRAFPDEFKADEALHFICKTERNKKKKESFRDWINSRTELNNWAEINGYKNVPLSVKAYSKLKEELITNPLWEYVTQNGDTYPKWANAPIKHPLPTQTEGNRWVDCTSNISGYEIEHITNLLLKVNMHSINAFMQQIRRSLSILERPLVTSRGDGKSYIYANFNPRYAQYATTILRTYYNFCCPYGIAKDIKETPAQRIGLTDKIYEFKDIIYFK